MDRFSTNPWRIIGLVAIVTAACIAAMVFLPSPAQRLFSGFGMQAQETSQSSPESVLISDDFSSPGWGTASNADSSVEYVDNALQMVAHTQNSYVWSPPNDEEYQNVHMEVTVINNGTDSTTAFGLICNKQASDASFYFFAITPAGQYAIAKATQGEGDVFLTNEDQWGYSELIPTEAASYRLGADCAHGMLTLFVDGQQIDSVSDSSYVRGGVALFTWSGEEATSTDVSFDDFLMTELP